MNDLQIDTLAWEKGAGLLPVIVQHARTGAVLMTGYANREALQSMLATGNVTLFSRTRQRLWVKGETSGNLLRIERVVADCDRDALLVLAQPRGPTCHTGAESCFSNARPAAAALGFLPALQALIRDRMASPPADSYTARLVAAGLSRMAQKVGEEGVEVALAAAGPGETLKSEAADLLFHLLVLLQARGLTLEAIVSVLEERHARAEAQGPAPR